MPPQTLKRQAEDVSFNNDNLNDDEYDVTWGGKRSRYIYTYTLQSPDLYSAISDSDEPESVYSMQSKATIQVVDESDTSSISNCCGTDCDCQNSSQSDNTEFEVVSSFSSTHDFNFSDSSDSSISEDIKVINFPNLSSKNSDNGYLPDETDNSVVKSQSNLPPPACFKTCLQCRKENPNPYFQFCYLCFRYRMQFFEDKPSPKSRGIKRLNTNMEGKNDNSLPNSQESGSFGLSSLNLSQKEIDDFTNQKNDKTDSLCNVCLIRPKNGIFNHGKTGHVYSCYQCAKQIWNKNGKCPICNVKVRTVTKIITV